MARTRNKMQIRIDKVINGFENFTKRQKILSQIEENISKISCIGFKIIASSSDEERINIQKELECLKKENEKLHKELETIK